MGRVTPENWNHCGLKTRQLRAFVGLGAVPTPAGAELIYSVILSDEEFCEIHQDEFGTLNEALGFLDIRYGEWNFYDLQGGEGGGGCGSCAAH